MTCRLRRGFANGNGLSAPRLIDLNGDSIPDLAYAGDLLGNLWKFDLSDPSSTNWKVAFGGTPFYVAKDGAGVRQPITTTPGWLLHPNGGLMVAVGTGRNLTDGDRLSGQTQSLYGIYDPTTMSIGATPNVATGSTTVVLDGTNNAVTDARASLVEQTVSAAQTATSAAGNELWTVSSNPVPYTGTGAKKGWFIDLPVARERAYKSMQWFRGRLFKIPTGVLAVGGDPNVETCTLSSSAGAHFLSVLDIINGSPPNQPVFKYKKNPITGVASRLSDSANGNTAWIETVDSSGDSKGLTPSTCTTCQSEKLLGLPPILLRPTWRQAQ